MNPSPHPPQIPHAFRADTPVFIAGPASTHGLPVDDPLGYAAERVAKVLKAMYEAETGSRIK